MTKATKALERACVKLEDALDASEYLHYDCELASVRLLQSDFNRCVDDCGGDLAAAKRELVKSFKADVRTVLRNLKALREACAAVEAAFPAVAQEQLQLVQELDYTGDDSEEPDEGYEH